MPKPVIQLKNLLPRMPKAVADGIHDLLQEPDGAEVVRKGVSEPSDIVSASEMIADQLVSTPHVDHDKEIVDPAGADFSVFLKNPVCLWSHNYSIPAIGSDLEIRATTAGVRAKTRYASTPFAKEIFELKRTGHLKTSSVGFCPLDRISKDDKGFGDEARRIQTQYGIDPKNAVIITTKWLLLEHSDCNIPSNPFALMLSLGKMQDPDPSLNMELQVACVKSLEGASEIIDIIIKSGLDAEQLAAIFKDAMNVSLKPYPNEHACRLQDPGKYSEMRRGSRETDGKTFSVIYGKLKDGDNWEEQAFRYNKDDWSAEEAGAHCKAHEGTFEAASSDETRTIARVALIKSPRVIKCIGRESRSITNDTLLGIVRTEINTALGRVESSTPQVRKTRTQRQR